MRTRSSRTGVVGFHAQKHTRTTKDGAPRVYYQFWGQITHLGKTLKTPRYSDLDKAFTAYQLLRAAHNFPPITESPRHPWASPETPSGGDPLE